MVFLVNSETVSVFFGCTFVANGNENLEKNYIFEQVLVWSSMWLNLNFIGLLVLRQLFEKYVQFMVNLNRETHKILTICSIDNEIVMLFLEK